MEVGQRHKRFYSATGSSTLTLCRKVKSHLCFTMHERHEFSSCSVMKRSQITMHFTVQQSRVHRGFQHPERIWRKPESMENMRAFCNKARMGMVLNSLCFCFFSGLHYQLGISLYTDTRSSCIRCYEGIS